VILGMNILVGPKSNNNNLLKVVYFFKCQRNLNEF
jgi:hypothetical protein